MRRYPNFFPDRLMKLVISLATTVLFVSTVYAYDGQHTNLESNYVSYDEVVQLPFDDPVLPDCEPQDVCALIQVNARGLQRQQYCKCPGRRLCPRIWDPQDGKSITQGSDQYKYCDRAPDVPHCSRQLGEIAYSFTYKMSTQASLVKVHCLCPALHIHERLPAKDEDYIDEDLFPTYYTCSPMPACTHQEHACKIITESAKGFWVREHCLCHKGESCPSITSRGMKTSAQFNGLVHEIQCQNPH